jgi:ribosomal-protein-alanine N-acetyltransferase
VTPDDLARIHARAMTVPGPWSAQTLAGFLSAPGAILATSGEGFALGRVIADQAELLTLAVDPADRRKGHARRCLTAYEDAARDRGARISHLEVAVSNTSAIALYASQGYRETGRRPAYYKRPEGGTEDALTLSRAL